MRPDSEGPVGLFKQTEPSLPAAAAHLSAAAPCGRDSGSAAAVWVSVGESLEQQMEKSFYGAGRVGADRTGAGRIGSDWDGATSPRQNGAEAAADLTPPRRPP